MKTLKSDQPLACRNQNIIGPNYNSKLESLKVKLGAGLYAQSSHYLVELKDCLVQDKETQSIANRIAELLTYHQIPITDERKILGVRTIMVRRSRKTGQVQIIIVTNRQLNLTQFVKDLVKDYPEVVTVAVNTNTAKLVRLWGQDRDYLGAG